MAKISNTHASSDKLMKENKIFTVPVIAELANKMTWHKNAGQKIDKIEW